VHTQCLTPTPHAPPAPQVKVNPASSPRKEKTEALAAAKAKEKTKPKFKANEEVLEGQCDICKSLRIFSQLEKGCLGQVQCVDGEACEAVLQPTTKRSRKTINYAGCE